MYLNSRQGERAPMLGEVVPPGGKCVCLPDESLHEQAYQNLSAEPCLGTIGVVLRDVTHAGETLEALEGEFDLPPDSVSLERVSCGELSSGHRREDAHIPGHLHGRAR